MVEDLDNPVVTPPKKKGKSLIILLLLACLAGGGVAGWMFWRRAKAPRAPEPESVKEVLHLEDFVVNLADSENRAFVRLGLDLGLSEAPKGKEKEGGGGPNPIPAIRDTVLGVVSVYKSDDLLTAEGKEKLKRELLGAIQKREPQAHVMEVYFTEFLVQR